MYLASDNVLTNAFSTWTVDITVKDSEGNQTTKTVTIELPPDIPAEDKISDAFRDSGSHRDGITFDLRPVGESADGETLYTTFLDPSGDPYLPGSGPINDIEGGYTYGQYFVGNDGILRYEPNETLFKDKFAEFGITGLSNIPDGLEYLSRPTQDLLLIAMSTPSSEVTQLARRTATPRLQNSKPVSFATGKTVRCIPSRSH